MHECRPTLQTIRTRESEKRNSILYLLRNATYKTTNKVHISGDLRTIHYKAMYTGGNLTIRAQNLCRTETLPKSHANNDAAI